MIMSFLNDIWFLGFIGYLLGVILAPQRVQAEIRKHKIHEFVAGQIIVLVALFWPVISAVFVVKKCLDRFKERSKQSQEGSTKIEWKESGHNPSAPVPQVNRKTAGDPGKQGKK